MSDVIVHARRPAVVQPPPAVTVARREPVLESPPLPQPEEEEPAFADLVAALTEEAMAVARMLRAQADLLERTLGHGFDLDVLQVQSSVTAMLRALCAKDRLLVLKLNALSAVDPGSGTEREPQ